MHSGLGGVSPHAGAAGVFGFNGDLVMSSGRMRNFEY